MKIGRKQLLLSLLSLMLCFSMLLGTTYAWFTDSVTSVDNIIKAGNLDIAMYWNDDLSDNWKNVKNEQKIFDSDKWEPGYTEVRYIKIVNEGNLAFKYAMDILPLGAVSALANVIDVYFIDDPDAKLDNRTQLTTPVGTLAQVIAGNIPANGTLENKNDEAVVAIALKMRENAGNEYQGLSIGDSFTVQLMATQLAYEEDAFDNKYDENTTLPSIDQSASADVTLDAGGNVANEVTLAGEAASATVPAGVKADEGTTSMTLTVTELVESSANVVVEENETSASLDVHVDGVAADNTTPIAIAIPEYLPVGLNIGNYRLYHVENGTAVAMTLLADGEPPAHNTYSYDPATGDVTLYMATFSEVKFVAETESKWEGNLDYSWYTNAVTPIAEGEPDYVIANADQLAALSAIVGGMNGQTQDSFKDKTIKLLADINLGDKESENNPGLIFYPIGYYNSDGTYGKTNTAITSGLRNFEGAFDGNGNTVKNFYQNTWEMKGDHDWYDAKLQYYRDGMGLFGKIYGGTVKNLTVDSFSSDGEIATTGVIAAYAEGATFENIAITNCNPRVYNIGNGGIVGCVGWYAKEANLKTTFKNITVDNTNKISALWGSYDVACGGLVGQYYPTSGQTSAGTPKNGGIDMINCHVSAQMDVYNDVCGNYQYYAYRYAGMMIGSIRENTTNEDGKTIPDMTGISATGCTVNYGDWNDYYYCEFEKNGHPSYSGPDDYKFSRVAHSELQFTDSNGNGLVDADERASVIGCKHDHTDKENHQAIYLPFHQLFTGYGWGVNSIGLEKYSGIVTNLDITEGEQEESVVKFKGTNIEILPNGIEISIADLFTAIPEASVTIRSEAVHVGVQNLDEDGTVTATFTPNNSNWANSTIKLTGTGRVAITIQDYYFCTPTTAELTVVPAEEYEMFELVFKNTNDYLYRVGNINNVVLNSLFESPLNATLTQNGVKVNVATITNATGSFKENTSNWANGEIDFNETGIVRITISTDGAQSISLPLEVVTATNVTNASFSGNCVLLNDVSPSTTCSTSGIIYGNGFTVNLENAPISEKNGAVFHLYDGTILKNISIIGKEFTTVAMNVNDTNYGVSTVRAWGTVIIENSYISGCRSAVSATGTELTIKDSVIANGVYANIDFRSGILNLHNVTTINEPHTVNGTTIVGLGIVGNMTASAGRQINITGTLTQYNWVSQADCKNIKASGIDNIFNSVFTDNKYASLRYTYGGTAYVNTGILSLCSDFSANAISGIPSNYGGMVVTATISNVSVTGYVWAPGQAGTLSEDDMKYHNKTYDWTANDQGTSFIPSAFDYSGAGVTAENGVIQISYESGSSHTLTAETIQKLFKATKYGENLPYKVIMNGVDYTAKDIIFDSTVSQNFTITFEVTDNLVYDKDGKLTDTTYTVKKPLKVFATVVDKGADAPSFTFYYGTKGSASAGTPHTTQPTNNYTSTILQIGTDHYIMPNVNATSANAIGSKTIDGKTIYYPIVDGINVRSGSSTDYDFTRYYPIFKAVKISDNGTEYSYTSTKEMPATVSWISGEIDSGNGASSLNDGFGLYNNQYLCRIQKKAGDAEAGGTSVIKYSYTALDGNTYYYYVGYRFYDEDEGGLCITPDTLITLADGTQMRVDALTGHEELLVWNHENGRIERAPIAYIVDHEGTVSEREILHLTFDNGKTVKIIGEHVFFDATQNKYVAIDGNNVDSLVGHTFLALSADGTAMERVQLISVTREIAETAIYEVVSYKHLTCFTEGILSTSAFLDPLLNIFDVDSNTWAYDTVQVQEDIETYGLYSYADFDGLISEEAFELYNAAYLKIAVGKGIITWNDILDLIDIYFNVGVDPIN